MGIGIPSLHDEPFDALFYLPQYRAFQFAIGGLAAYAIRYTFPGIFALGLIFLIAAFFIASDTDAAHFTAPLITLAMSLLMVKAPFLDIVSKVPPIEYLAKVSYQLYLVHWPVIVLWQNITLSPLSWLEASLCIALCILLSDGLYRLTNKMRSA